ncbi:MAG: hypothetical protein ACQEWV_33645, partial [Bacillota bacterium]
MTNKQKSITIPRMKIVKKAGKSGFSLDKKAFTHISIKPTIITQLPGVNPTVPVNQHRRHPT